MRQCARPSRLRAGWIANVELFLFQICLLSSAPILVRGLSRGWWLAGGWDAQIGFRKKDAEMIGWSHQTGEGTFLIEAVHAGGSTMYRLWYEKDTTKTDLGLYFYPSTAAESIGLGRHDRTPGLVASSFGVPSRAQHWSRR